MCILWNHQHWHITEHREGQRRPSRTETAISEGRPTKTKQESPWRRVGFLQLSLSLSRSTLQKKYQYVNISDLINFQHVYIFWLLMPPFPETRGWRETSVWGALRLRSGAARIKVLQRATVNEGFQSKVWSISSRSYISPSERAQPQKHLKKYTLGKIFWLDENKNSCQ